MRFRPLSDRFWEKVRIVDPGSCWEWQGATNRHGYGRIWLTSQGSAFAHRVSFFLATGRWPDKLVCHHCDNPRCVNPAHLYEGTQADNNNDANVRGRSIAAQRRTLTHCKRGHPFDENSARSDGKGRSCRVCNTLRAREASRADPSKRASYMRDWRAKQKARHPDSPGGVDIVDCERTGLDSAAVGLRAVAK